MGRFAALFVALTAAACAGQVSLSQYKLAPEDDVKLAVVYRAPPGTSFTDVNEKTLNVSVSVANRPSTQPPIYLFARQYSVQAADIDWAIAWENPGRGRIDFVAYPQGRSRFEITEEQRAALGTPIGHIVVVRRAADAFEVAEEQWSLPYRTKDYPRGLAKW
jgi:hypothetical protein